MRKLMTGVAVAVAAAGLALGGLTSAEAVAPTGVTSPAAATAACPVPQTACYPLLANSLSSLQAVNNSLAGIDIKDNDLTTADLKDGTIGSVDLAPALYSLLLAVPNNGVTTGKIADGAVTLAKLDPALQAKINGPAYLANWGEIFRNTIGNARAELGTSSSGEGLNFNVPTAADGIMWGNETDFAGKQVALSAVKFEVFQTGENNAIPGNMPSIKFEMNPDVTGATYTTLVYTPDNTSSNAWATIDGKADAGNHWGFTGTYFNTGTDRCGLNGARCTLAEALTKIGSNAKFISAGVGKGRDNAWHGAIRSLTVGSTTYQFTAGGVLAAQ